MGISCLHFFLLCLSVSFSLPSLAFASKESYVVYLGAHSHGPSATSDDYKKVLDAHHEFLGSFLGSKEKAKDAIFYSYTKHINGFSAFLREEEAMEISKHPNVVSVFLNKGKKLHTTRSWEFLGLEKNGRIPEESLMHRAKFGEDVIIANLDTGVWPESASFNDEGMGPIPSRWKGKCLTNTTDPIKCNRKLIGANIYYKGYEALAALLNITMNSSLITPRDNVGHGSHTLSIAGGRIVPASLYGHANGTAKGGSPGARVAAYTVCWSQPPDNDATCANADVLAAFDDAIHDGVDVLSLSIGADVVDYFKDAIAIGAFHAISNGIPVICSAGNDGPDNGTVTNVAPWIFTVGASTIDRRFQSDVFLGNKKHYKGESLAQYSLPAKKFYPLINAADARAANSTTKDAQFCAIGSLDPVKVKGKIVVCLSDSLSGVDKGEAVLLAGGAGMIHATEEIIGDVLIVPDIHLLPATNIGATDRAAVYSYINSTKSPRAYIQPVLTKFDLKPVPSVADFSSVGPNWLTPEILKPDVIAPGVAILAAYTQALSPTDYPFDTRRVPFIVMSGTSFACPHVTGIVGLLKTLHPDWSPSAIRSALMTSSTTRDNMDEPMKNTLFARATPFDYGAGLVQPNSAMDPGLVYDLTTKDYLDFLCASGYNSTQMMLLYDKPYSCPSKKLRLIDFNYPSITIPSLTSRTTVMRRAKNVGAPGTYKVRFSAPPNVSMMVKPESLTFKKTGEEKVFKVTLESKHSLKNDYVFGTIEWFDGVHNVRSPVVVKGP